MQKLMTEKRFDLACDVVTHIETGRVDTADKFILVIAARRLLSGVELTAQQTIVWNKYQEGWNS